VLRPSRCGFHTQIASRSHGRGHRVQVSVTGARGESPRRPSKEHHGRTGSKASGLRRLHTNVTRRQVRAQLSDPLVFWHRVGDGPRGRSTTITPWGARTRAHSSRPADRSFHSWMLLTLTTASCEPSGSGSDSAAARSTVVRCSTRAWRHRVRDRSTITADGSRPITAPFETRRAAATTPTPGPQPIITTLLSGCGSTNSTAAISMSALPLAITVAMMRPPQPSHGSMRFKMSTMRWYDISLCGRPGR
jgi:hypothetical protein